jgi:hypothetical protein
MSWQRYAVITFLWLGLLTASGCGISPSWPYAVDLSEFTEFHTERTPTCQEDFDRLVTNAICEASIAKRDSGEYVFQGSYTGSAAVLEAPPRTLTETEATRMLALFSDLHYDRADQPFCHIPVPGLSLDDERFLCWDDREFITYGCGHPRIDFGEVSRIEDFLITLVEGGQDP